jgi:hypothetical protein
MKTFIFIGLTIILFGCKKIVTEIKEVPTPIKHSWLYDSSMDGLQKIILSTVNLNDTTLVCSNRQIMDYVNSNQLNGSMSGNFLELYEYSGYGSMKPPSLSQRIGVFPVDSNRLKIFSVFNPIDNYGNFLFSPTYSSSATSRKGFPLAYFGSGYSIVDDRYILAPFEIDYTNEIARCVLIRVDTTKGSANSVQLGSATYIDLKPATSTIDFTSDGYYSYSFFNKFFILLSDQFYRVDTSGNVKSFGSQPISSTSGGILRMFRIRNNLFAICYSNTIYSIIVSTDFGETWSIFANNVDPNFANLTFENVDGNLYAYYMSHIFKFSLSGNSLNYVELDNDGLETNQITGINKAGKCAFVSTLSGLYYRDTTSFETPKK